MRIEGKNIIITGATSGIGKEAAVALARMNARLILPVRNMEKGEKVKKRITETTGNPDIHLMECDLASFVSVRRFASLFRSQFSELKVLINNAGIWEKHRGETHDGIEMNFGVNHLAPFLLTNLLLEPLRTGSPSRIVNVSSVAHWYGKINFDDPEGREGYRNFISYGQSKNANILFTRRLAQLVKDDGITANAMHPGFVATHLFDKHPVMKYGGRIFMKSPRKGAKTLVWLASSPDVEGVTGGFFAGKKSRTPAPWARDDKAAQKLWDISREYTGL